MRANEILNEAGIVDKLKGLVKGKKKPVAQPAQSTGQWPPAAGGPKVWREPIERSIARHTKAAAPAPKPVRKLRNPGKGAFGQMAGQLGDRPETTSQSSAVTNQMIGQLTKRKGMKAKKSDPRTALAMRGKGGSPEYQEYLKQLKQQQPAAQVAPVIQATEPEETPKAATGDTSSYEQPSTVTPQAADRVLTKLQNINDTSLLTNMKKVIDRKLGL